VYGYQAASSIGSNSASTLTAACAVAVVLVSACSSPNVIPPSLTRQVDRHVDFAALKRDVASHKGRLVLVGGEVLMVKRFKDQTQILPLICLFQVTRRKEAGQLAVCDIQEEAGIPFLRINDDEKLGQSLKNEGSRRRVPIHSSLIKLGFLEFVKKVKAAGHTRLFPSLTRGANGYSDPVGKFFGRLVRKVGITDPAIVLHSTRHTGISRLTGAGVPQDIREILVGHAATNVHGQTYVPSGQATAVLAARGVGEAAVR
jgi:integrase